MTGRKSKYETHVKPYLPEIEKWCNTMTEAQYANGLVLGRVHGMNIKRDSRN